MQIAHANGGPLLEAIARAVEHHLGEDPKHEPGELVVGLPLNMDGTEGPRARIVRSFCDRLAQRTGRVLHLQDERLTSVEADWRLAGTGMTHKQKKARRDAQAAAAILRDFLEARGVHSESEPGPGF